MPTELKKQRRSAIVSLIVTPVAIFAGIFMLTSDRVDCGGSQMQPGDTCKTTVNGIPTGNNSFDEQKQRDTWLAWACIGFGVISAGSSVRQLRRYRSAAAAAATEPGPVVAPPLPYQTASDLAPVAPVAPPGA